MNEQQNGRVGWKWDSVPAGCGVLAIRRRSDGKSLYLAVADMRQRAYDHHRMLMAGTHHNPELQAAWSAEEFEIVPVERVRHQNFLNAFKQIWIERSVGNNFNRKGSISLSERTTQ